MKVRLLKRLAPGPNEIQYPTLEVGAIGEVVGISGGFVQVDFATEELKSKPLPSFAAGSAVFYEWLASRGEGWGQMQFWGESLKDIESI